MTCNFLSLGRSDRVGRTALRCASLLLNFAVAREICELNVPSLMLKMRDASTIGIPVGHFRLSLTTILATLEPKNTEASSSLRCQGPQTRNANLSPRFKTVSRWYWG